MLPHSVLHGGPGLHGVSPAVIHYCITNDIRQTVQLHWNMKILHTMILGSS